MTDTMTALAMSSAFYRKEYLGASLQNRLARTAATASFRGSVLEKEEVVPVNAVSTWVLLSEVTVGR